MKAVFIALAMILSLGFSQPATAMTGNEMMDHYKSCDAHHRGDKTFDNYYSCSAVTNHITGIVGGYILARSWEGLEIDICFPDGVTYGQTNEIVRKYLKDHPENLHEVAGIAIMQSLLDVYPCD